MGHLYILPFRSEGIGKSFAQEVVGVLEACPRVHSRQELPERLVGLLWAVFILWRVHFVEKGLCLAVSAAGDISGVASPGGGAGKGSPAYPPAQRLAGTGGPCR